MLSLKAVLAGVQLARRTTKRAAAEAEVFTAAAVVVVTRTSNSNSGGGGGGGGSGFGPTGATLESGVASPAPDGDGEIELSYTAATVATTTPTTAVTTPTNPTAPLALAVTGVSLTPLLVVGSALVLSGAFLLTIVSARRRKTTI